MTETEEFMQERMMEDQLKLFNLFTDLINELVNSYENNDAAIKELIDERRRVYNLYARLMNSYNQPF